MQVEDYDEYGALPVHEMYVYSLPPSPPPSSPASTRSRKKNVMKRDINMLACDSDVERECCPSQASVKDNPVVCDVQESATARDDAMSDVQTSTCRKRERCATFTVVDYEAEIRNKERVCMSMYTYLITQSRRQKLHGEQLQCSMCHTTETCQWRSGPNGPRSYVCLV